MWSSSKKHDRGATTVTGQREFQLPVPPQSGNAPIVWVDRSLLAELCGEADRAGSNGGAGYLAGHWVIPGTEAVITTWSSLDRERSSSAPRTTAPERTIASSEIVPKREAPGRADVIGIWSTTPISERPPRWPRASRHWLALEPGFDPSAAMLQLVLEKGSVWRLRFWIWSRRGWLLPRAVLGPRAADVRLAAELKGA